jgi:hypothetical protein
VGTYGARGLELVERARHGDVWIERNGLRCVEETEMCVGKRFKFQLLLGEIKAPSEPRAYVNQTRLSPKGQ